MEINIYIFVFNRVFSSFKIIKHFFLITIKAKINRQVRAREIDRQIDGKREFNRMSIETYKKLNETA